MCKSSQREFYNNAWTKLTHATHSLVFSLWASLIPRCSRNAWYTLFVHAQIWDTLVIFRLTMMQLATTCQALWRKRRVRASCESLTQCHELLFASVLCFGDSVIPSIANTVRSPWALHNYTSLSETYTSDKLPLNYVHA